MRGFLLITAFVCGGVIMGLELTASRLLAPTFGYSTYVWGALLGVVMAGLSIGYYVGGRLADKDNTTNNTYLIILMAFLFSVLIPYYGSAMISLVENQGVILGSALGVLFVFGPPILLLAMVSPMIIKLNTTAVGEVGAKAGAVYSISTIGSIAGTFVTAFYLIPSYGTRITILVMAALLLIVALIGLGRKRYLYVVLLLAVVMILPQPSSPDIVYQTESEYSLIKVIQRGDTLRLVVNQDRWTQTAYRPGEIVTGRYWDYYTLGLFLADIDDVLVIGVAGGGSVRQLQHFRPDVRIDAVEIDPKMIEVAKEYFNLTEGERLNIIIEDGRTFIRNTDKRYDLISMDAFSGGPNIPYYLTTREFFQDAYDRLNDGGVLMMNVLSVNRYMKLTESIAVTMGDVFTSVYIIDLDTNQILIAYKNKTSIQEYYMPLKDVTAELTPAASHAQTHTRTPTGDGMILTDDHAPIERMIHEMIYG